MRIRRRQRRHQAFNRIRPLRMLVMDENKQVQLRAATAITTGRMISSNNKLSRLLYTILSSQQFTRNVSHFRF